MLAIVLEREISVSVLPPDLDRVYKVNNTPEKLQWYLANCIEYQWSEDLVSAYQAFLDEQADCYSGALLAAQGLETMGIKPWIILLLANGHDMHHNITVYEDPQSSLWGSIGKSRDPKLMGKPAIYKTPFDLAFSYFDDYSSSYEEYKGEKTMIGCTDPIDIMRIADVDCLLVKGVNHPKVIDLHQRYTDNVGWMSMIDGIYRYPILFDEKEDVIVA